MDHQGRQQAVLAVVRNLGDGCRDAELRLGEGCSGPLRACIRQNLCYLCMLCLGQRRGVRRSCCVEAVVRRSRTERRAGVEVGVRRSCLLGTILVL